RHGGGDLRSCLSGRHDRLSHQASRRAGGQGERAQQFAHQQAPVVLGGQGLDILPAGRRHSAVALGGMMSDAAATIPAGQSASVQTRVLRALTSRMVILVPSAWLFFFFLVPFRIVFKIALSRTAVAIPPYAPVFSLDEGVSGFFSQLRELSL